MICSQDHLCSSDLYFEKEYKETVKEMLYEPELKQQIIDKAIKEAAFEIKKKGIAKLLDGVKA